MNEPQIDSILSELLHAEKVMPFTTMHRSRELASSMIEGLDLRSKEQKEKEYQEQLSKEFDEMIGEFKEHYGDESTSQTTTL